MTAQWQGTAVPLTLTEFWVVHALALHPGHVRSREQLMAAANVVLDDGTVTLARSNGSGRSSSRVDPAFDAIQTVYGMGYRWQAELSRLERACTALAIDAEFERFHIVDAGTGLLRSIERALRGRSIGRTA